MRAPDLLTPGCWDDTDSCLVLGYCGTRRDLAAYADSDVFDPHFGLVQVRDDWYFRPLTREWQFTTTRLLAAAQPKSHSGWHAGEPYCTYSHQIIKVTLPPRLPGLELRMLQISGPRLHVPDQPSVLTRKSDGADACYAAWADREPALVGRHDLPLYTDAVTEVRGLQFAAGVLVAGQQFALPGSAAHAVTTVFMEATLFYGPPDDLRLHLYGHRKESGVPDQFPLLPAFLKSGKAPAGAAWTELYPQVQKGLPSAYDLLVAPPVPDALAEVDEARRTAFTKSLEALGSERWVEALDGITEVWQLVLACTTLKPAAFAHRRTPYKRGRDMVNQYCLARPDRQDIMRPLWEEATVQLQAHHSPS